MTRKHVTLAHLRRYAVARSLFKPTSLGKAIGRLGFVQADPIRAPARAQDLTLRHRVVGYTAGELERRYARLRLEEDFFVNYGFLPRAHHMLMHPRAPAAKWTNARRRRAQAVLEFVRKRGEVHPRVVDARFAHGKITNWFGGSTNATTELLDDMHYRGLLRVARREAGTRIYAARTAPRDSHSVSESVRFDTLVDLVMRKYAPVPAASLAHLLSLLCRGVPQWKLLRTAALARAKQRCAYQRVEGIDWYWPAGRISDVRPLASGGAGAAAHAVRSHRLGPPPLHAALGLVLSFRGLYACAEEKVGLLRPAVVVARSGDRVGQPERRQRRPAELIRLCQRSRAH